MQSPGVTMTCLVAEAGTYSAATGMKFEAKRVSVSNVDRTGSFGTGTAVSYGQTYTVSTPVVIGQVQTANDMRFQVRHAVPAC